MESRGQPGSTGGEGRDYGGTTPSTTPGTTPPPTWQSTPDQPASGGGLTGGGGGGFVGQPGGGASIPGTAGYFYADVPNRAVAYIIDLIILAIINFIVQAILGAVTGPTTTFNPAATDPSQMFTVNTGAVLISTIVSTIISGAYFVWTWTSMRASPGQRILGMQVGNESDGATLTLNQAVIRWVLLGAPFGIAQALAGVSGLAVLIGIAALVWFIVLLVTTAQSPTKQGLHDRYAHSVVVKAGRSVS